MNAHGDRTSVFVDDRDVIGEIERMLPQQSVESLRERILQDKVYDPTYAEAFNSLKESFVKIGFKVHDAGLAAAFRRFKLAAISFDDHLITEFAFDPRRKIYAIHANRRDDNALMTRLRKSYDRFSSAYKNLLEASALRFRKFDVAGPVRLSAFAIKFSDREGIISLGSSRCQLPAFKNGHCLCRVMFSKNPKEPVDWSDVAYEMFGKDPLRRADRVRLERKVRDAMYAVNRAVEKATGTTDPLFTWKNKTIVRNYGR